MYVLVLNVGSSSIKYSLYDDTQFIQKGLVDKIGLKDSSFQHDHKIEHKRIRTFTKAIKLVFREIEPYNIRAIAHRVVHGGPINKPQIITKELLRQIDYYSQLAPLHNTPEIKVIKLCLKKYSHIPQIAIFDTSFHSTMPEKAYLYAIPYKYYEKYKIRKYGFHGQSHAYIAEETAKLLRKPANKLKIISCHLGNGCSITAIDKGKSIDTSMGFTPLEGLVMGTRSGDIDPSLIPFLMKKEHLSLNKVENILNHNSGLLGLSGISRDVRDLIKSNSRRAKLALDVAIYRLVKYIGAYNLILKGADAIVFTAGIGENEAEVRKKVCEYLIPLGVQLDLKANEKNKLIISKPSSKIKILIIPADEELMMVRQTLKRLKK